MSKIKEGTLQEAGDLIARGLQSHMNKLNVGYLNAGEKDFRVSLGLIINEGLGGNNHKLKVDMSFDLEKVKDTFSTTVNEDQGKLFDIDDERVIPCYLRPELDGVFESVCSKCHERMDIVFVSGEGLPRVIGKDEELPELKEGQMLQHRSCPGWADDDCRAFIESLLLACDEEDTAVEAVKETAEEGKKKNKKIAGGKK